MVAAAVVAGLGGLLGAFSSNKAAKAQAAAAAADRALQEKIYNETVDRFKPYYQSGTNALNALSFELGLGDRPTFGGSPAEITQFSETIPGAKPTMGGWGFWQGDQFVDGSTPDQKRTGYRVGDQVFYDKTAAEEYAAANPVGATEYQGFQATPWQNYLMDSGRQAIDASASVRGSLNSGATLKRLSDYGQTTGNSFYENYLQRLSGMAAIGQGAAANTANAGANYGQMASNAISAGGNAQAAGYIGVGNAINQGIGNVLGALNYQSMQSATPSYTASNGINIPMNVFNNVQNAL